MSSARNLAPRPIGRRQRLAGLVAILLVLALAGVGVHWLRAWWTPPASEPIVPEPSPTPTRTFSAWPIPEAARLEVYRSGTPASGEFWSASVTAEPALPAASSQPYAVRVETTANVDPDEAARLIQRTLDDPRGWVGYGNNNFRLVGETAEATMLITIASPATTDALCGDEAATEGSWSCLVDDEIILNSDRWHFMVPAYSNLDEYRSWLVNHHVGRFLGQGVTYCEWKGQPAPVMSRQERDLAGCLPNAWPKLT